jgi:hypothetical protein
VGCNIERTDDYVEFTQTVLLQSFVDEFNIKSGRLTYTPAESVKVLVKGEIGTELKSEEQIRCGQIAAHDEVVQTGNLQLCKRIVKIYDNRNNNIVCESHEESHGVLCCN